METRRDLVFVSAFLTPFIQDDLEFLATKFTVHRNIGHGIAAALRITMTMFVADVAVCWFASVYAFVSVFVGRMLGVKSIVIVGGVDAAKDPELNYGIWLSPWRARLVKYVFHHANKILVVDPSLKIQAMELAGYDGANIAYLPTGFDAQFWKPLGAKDDSVLTVAVVRDLGTARVKGLDTLIAAAWNMPAVNFVVVGVEPQIGLSLRPPMNMKFYAPMPRKEILRFYQEARVYCQPSRREGLPNALCEAMLCGCIPVASRVGGNPTAIGNDGILVPPDDVDSLVTALHHALTTEEQIGVRARSRAVSLFPKEKRETELLRAIESLLK
jgi:glycosyltransferase involved in cell wall biosynthesis